MVGIPGVVGFPREGVPHGIELDDVGVGAVYDPALVDVDFGVSFCDWHKM